MPTFDLRGIKVAKYVNTSGVITYLTPTAMGDAMNVNLELKFAEGRLYAEGTLAEYLKRATGGTISIGVKYIPDAAQKMLYGCEESSRVVGTGSPTKTITGLKFGAKNKAGYVGVAFYAPDEIDSVDKFTCVFVHKALFGPPAMKLAGVEGNSITFQTPTTTGEFLADDGIGKLFFETGVADTEADAISWVNEVLK
ncbi:MAG: hypothetical protein RR365_11025 [Bacteroides sp.]